MGHPSFFQQNAESKKCRLLAPALYPYRLDQEEPEMNGKEIVSKFLAAEAKQDVQGMGDVLAENIIFEMPFAFPGLPDRVEGKGTLVEFLEQFLGKEHGFFTGWELHNIRIHPGGDPELFFAELDGKGVVAQSGYQYRQKYIILFRLSDGRISHWREYWNPIPLREALASVPMGQVSK
jgi:ketosteroid isomerase-like protein